MTDDDDRTKPSEGSTNTGGRPPAIDVGVGPRRRRRLVTIGVPALATAAVLAVVGLALAAGPGAGPRVRTNPALPGDGPPEASTSTPPASTNPVVVAGGAGWRLLLELRDGTGACAQVRPRAEDRLDPSFCGASEAELTDRGISLAFAERPPSGGAPTTLPPATVAYGLVPEESADVVLSLRDGGDVVSPALPVDGAPDAFASELPAGAAVTRVVVYDGDGRILHEEDLRAAG